MNADIYPNEYAKVRATSYIRTSREVSVPDRLIPLTQSYWRDRMAYAVISEWPFGKAFREYVLDPLIYRDDRVEWRNYEASYRVDELEPSSRKSSTYVLQEYFVPTENLVPFVSGMAKVLQQRHVNVINVSIRFAHRDPGTLLAWARKDVFAFVLYYKQGTSEDDRKAVGSWTRELIDQVIAVNGSYYLPYQIHATIEQFHAAYPNADQFFALKAKLDPENQFHNRLWDTYYVPELGALKALDLHESSERESDAIRSAVRKVPGYVRDEGQTYLTFPEWFLVYSPDEYARYIKQNPNSGFPYFRSIAQFWGSYRDVYKVTRANGYPTNWGYHLMIGVIGSSYTAEYAIKGVYENTIGRFTEWTSNNQRTPEDDFAALVAKEYVDFIRVDPWYEFSFWQRFKRLWLQTDPDGSNRIRRWERRAILSVEYLAKTVYGEAIKLATKAVYGDADTEMMVLTAPAVPTLYQSLPATRTLRGFPNGSRLLLLPRYEQFRDAIVQMSKAGISFLEIAGNKNILLTCVVPSDWRYAGDGTKVLFERPILTQPGSKRVALTVEVPHLNEVVLELGQQGIAVEHIYDY